MLRFFQNDKSCNTLCHSERETAKNLQTPHYKPTWETEALSSEESPNTTLSTNLGN